MAGEEEPQTWRHALGVDHPLIGRVWDVKGESWIDPGALAHRLEQMTHVLLGEKHDNADHHRLQAWLVRSLAKAGRRPAVALEMLGIDEQSIVDRQLKLSPTDLPGLRAALRWEDKGWPGWELYEPVFDVALAEGLPIVAANISGAMTRDLAAQGVSALEGDLARAFELDRPLPPDLQRRLAADLAASHCGHVSEDTAGKMILIQRARDAHMARRLMLARRADAAVLIAGAFHVRNDYGVPAQLAKLDAGRPVASVGFIEVRTDRVEPHDYAGLFGTEHLPFDYVWFTSRVDDEDPCEKFEEELKQIRAKP
jgi:uncharacterized iron-regulated protein